MIKWWQIICIQDELMTMPLPSLVLCKKSHIAAALFCLNVFYCPDSARNIVWKYCHKILSRNIVTKYCLKILSQNIVIKFCLNAIRILSLRFCTEYCIKILSPNIVTQCCPEILSQNIVPKYCLEILSQNFVWMPFGFYRPDSARNIFLSATKLNFISLLLLPLLSLHVLSPFPVVSFLSNPCTITLDPTEPRTVTVEHFASATRPPEMDVAPQAAQLIPTIFSEEIFSKTLRQSPGIYMKCKKSNS